MTEFEPQVETTEETKPAPLAEKLYPLDWKDTDVKFAKGRFVHNLSRPSAELMVERQDELEIEIPISKDGSYALPDEVEQEQTDAKYYERIKNSATGYGEREIPTVHKAKAFQALFLSEISVDEDSDIFDEEITIIEEIGSGDDPDWTLRHRITVPDEKEMKKIRQMFKNGRMAPDKRSRQKFVQKINLRKAMMYFAQCYVRTDGASVGGEKFSPERRDEFIVCINPLVQREILRVLIEELTGKLLD